MKVKNVRYIIAAITTLSAYSVYVSRNNLSIAIIAMVDDVDYQLQSNHHNNLNDLPAKFGDSSKRIVNQIVTVSSANLTSSSSSSRRIGTADNSIDSQHLGPMTSVFQTSTKSLNEPLISQMKFDWDPSEQGQILGAFFYGYIILQIPGARIAETIGSYWIILAASAGSGLVSLIFPLSTQLNSIYLMMMLRCVMGCCQSAFFPAAYVLFCRWLPEKERAVLLPIMFVGSNIGSISAYIISSYLITSSYGWPSVFYLSGLICLLMTVLWCFYGANGPEDSKLITSEELAYIKNSINGIDGNSHEDSNSGLIDLTDVSSDIQTSCKLMDNVDEFKNTNFARIIPRPKFGEFDGNKQAVVVVLGSNTNSNYNNNSSSSTDTINKQCANDTSIVVLPKRPLRSSFSVERRRSSLASAINVLQLRRASTLLAKQQMQVHWQANSNSAFMSSNNVDKDKHQQQQQLANEADWGKLLRSVPIWTLILTMYGNEWSNVILSLELPTYLNTALGFPIRQNGQINSFFQLTFAVASPIFSSLGAYLLSKHMFGMKKIHVRKLFQSLATFGQMACFMGAPMCGSNTGMIILLMFAAVVFKACANAGDIMVAGDLSPEFAGTIFAFANSVGNTAGFFAPTLAGLLIKNNKKRDEWTPFWFCTSAIMCFSGLVFLIFGDTKPQDYFKPPKKVVDSDDKAFNDTDSFSKIKFVYDENNNIKS